MHKHTLLIGVDPGLVHTGVVMLAIRPAFVRIHVGYTAINGPDATAVAKWILDAQIAHDVPTKDTHVFIEGYKPRSHFGTDTKMLQAVSEMKAAVPGSKVLLNTGVKKVIRQPLMDLLEVWKFHTPTNHDDLRSAARIALLGAVKDEELNQLITQIVSDHVKGETWNVLS